MVHYQKWAQNKNQILAPIYLQIASASQELHEIIHFRRKGKRIEGDIPLPEINTWLQFYKSPEQIYQSLFNLMQKYNQNSSLLYQNYQRIAHQPQCIHNHQEKLKSANRKSIREAKSNNESFNKLSKDLSETSIQDLNEEINEAQADKIQNWMKSPEAIFLMRVQVPCFMLYGTFPHTLLKMAQSGNDKALEKLIRLDKSIIFEPKISEIIHQAQGLKAQARMAMIQKAFISPPKAKLSRKKVKCLLGGLISHISILFNQKLSAAEIRKLFDAIALDMTGDIDQDLENMVGEVFEKEIQRSRKFWNLLLADKK